MNIYIFGNIAKGWYLHDKYHKMIIFKLTIIRNDICSPILQQGQHLKYIDDDIFNDRYHQRTLPNLFSTRQKNWKAEKLA